MTVETWPSEAWQGTTVVVGVGVTGPEPVVRLEVDLLGDGLPGVTLVGEDLRAVAAVRVPMRQAGTFRWQVRVWDRCGGHDATQRLRQVTVRPSRTGGGGGSV